MIDHLNNSDPDEDIEVSSDQNISQDQGFEIEPSYN